MPRAFVLVLCCVVFAFLSTESRAQSVFKVTLLGTASPSPRPT